MKKKYECHDCGEQFELAADREPYCPQCRSQSITFEGFVQFSVFERVWKRVKPVIYFCFLPWKFFAGRSIKILNSQILMVLSVAVLLTATWQVSVLPGVNSSIIFANFLSVFRNYSAFTGSILAEGRFAQFLPAPLVIFVILLLIEFIFFVTFNFTQWLLGGGANQSQTGLIFSAAIWIPNILLGAFTFLVARGAVLDFWGPALLTSSTVRLAGIIITLWCLYIFMGGCLSLPAISLSSAGYLIPAVVVSQFLIALILLFLVDVYLFPFLGLIPFSAAETLPWAVIRLVYFPLAYLL